MSGEEPSRARLFVALWPPAELARALAEDVRAVLGAERGLRLVRWGELHLTLEFLGELERALVPRLAEELAAGLAGLAAPRLALTEPGCFPPRGRPRVWWLGLAEERPALAALHAATVAAAARAGRAALAERAAQPFAPHLTVARTRERARVPRELERAFLELRVAGAFTAAEVLLVESRLGAPRDERYAVRARVALTGGSGAGEPG